MFNSYKSYKVNYRTLKNLESFRIIEVPSYINILIESFIKDELKDLNIRAVIISIEEVT